MSFRPSQRPRLMGLAAPVVLVLLSSLSLPADEPKSEAPKSETAGGIRFTIPTLKIADGGLKIAAGEAAGYWIGVSCHPVDGELREKLKLDAGQGLAMTFD